MRAGEIGELRAFNGMFGYALPARTDIRYEAAMGGGVLYDTGFYPVTMSRFCFEAEPVAVLARAVLSDHAGVDVLSSAVLEFPHGQATLTCGMELGPMQRAFLLGTKGHLDVPTAWNPASDRPSELTLETSPSLESPTAQRRTFDAVDQYAILVAAFARAATGGGPAPVPLEDSVKNTAVLEALVRSTTSGRWEKARSLVAAVLAVAMAASAASGCRGGASPSDAPPPAAPARVTISLVGTNDLHGRIEALPPFGGYLANLRRARDRDGGAVLLVDAGDLFQGTLPSNLTEGAAVVRAYNALGYAAAALGNHEFDFGPVGPEVTAKKPGKRPGDNPRGALRARAAEASFPFLDANLVDTTTGAPPAWKNVVPDVLLDVAGIKVGIVGVATASTPRTTLAANFAGLAVKPLAPAIAAAVADLHRKGATVVIAAAHAGGVCKRFDAPEHFDACEADGEIFQVARELAANGAVVDAIVAGHTHEGVAHRVSGIPIIEAFANGHAFSRIDPTVERPTGRAVDARIFPPQRICAPERCGGESYEGAPVVPTPPFKRRSLPRWTRPARSGSRSWACWLRRPSSARRRSSRRWEICLPI